MYFSPLDCSWNLRIDASAFPGVPAATIHYSMTGHERKLNDNAMISSPFALTAQVCLDGASRP
jgi:hypothetical protein